MVKVTTSNVSCQLLIGKTGGEGYGFFMQEERNVESFTLIIRAGALATSFNCSSYGMGMSNISEPSLADSLNYSHLTSTLMKQGFSTIVQTDTTPHSGNSTNPVTR